LRINACPYANLSLTIKNMAKTWQDVQNVKFLTINETADRFRRSPHTIRYWIARRQIGFVRIGRSILVPEQAIAELIARSFIPPTETAPVNGERHG
jgi:excisionase family DNA binding protein